jgi:hypothetical protein
MLAFTLSKNIRGALIMSSSCRDAGNVEKRGGKTTKQLIIIMSASRVKCIAHNEAHK